MMQANCNNQSEIPLYNSLCTYIVLCNDIIGANQTRFPFRQIWQALEAEIAGRPIEYTVIRGAESAWATATLIDFKITLITSTTRSKWPAITQKIEWPYMSKVLENPAKFIANPALVDWNMKIDNKVVQLFS